MLVVSLTVLLIVQVVLPTSPRDLFSRLVAQSDDPSLIRYGLVKAPEEAVNVSEKNQAQFAVLKIPVRSEDVIFYWVSSLPLDESIENGLEKTETD